MNHGSLFSGIGGFDLAAEWMGWNNRFHCEWNSFGQRVLKHYWPQSQSYGDITKTDFTIWRGRIDVLTGGFPCQPYSLAGKRLGNEDERHLWPEMLRAIREIQPRWIVGENVLGLVNWNGGLVFHEVQAELEAQGYEVQPFILPACSVNAPHRRDRVWFVAYSECFSRKTENGIQDRRESIEPKSIYKSSIWATSNTNSNGQLRGDGQHEVNASQGGIDALGDAEQGVGNGNNSNADYSGLERSKVIGSAGSCRKRGEEQPTGYVRTAWEEFPTVAPVCHGDDGLSTELDGITFSKWRQESVKAGGNAIVPQVVLQIFKSIEQYEKLCSH